MRKAAPQDRDGEAGLELVWSRRWTLVHRILAVNLLVVLIFALGILWLDVYRNQLREERIALMEGATRAAAAAAERVRPDEREGLLAAMAGTEGPRFRLYDPQGRLVADSWNVSEPTYRLRDPDEQAWQKRVARALDDGFNALVGEAPTEDFVEPEIDRASAWPELAEARVGDVVTRVRIAPERTPVFSAAAPVGANGVMLATLNDRSYTRTVRRERASIAMALAGSVLLAVLLSLFLARTIARPLRRIAIAAHRVRLGRARAVRIPRLPSRRDEIGMLARSVSDMSQSLRQRIDKIEAFAADVAHELKNPLASLRSAVDGLERIEDPDLRRQLLDVVRQDVVRLDRLVSDISEAARTDAELTRAQFEPVDLGDLVEQLVTSWEERRETSDVRLAYARPRKSSAIVPGDDQRLARAIDNLIDNAISFSPPGSVVEISVINLGSRVRVQVRDEGPGVSEDQREKIFKRFHSHRPETENFGRHSGLGLAIASAIVEGHDGTIIVEDRTDASSGACFTITLPAWGSE
ncbi:sensor histidine kinase [Sphingomicrobium lutaoense]|uniref:histidine kinase n=1 Tax=Sphingomicrobium lutaoense TaxID=515949 RepID=A0A839Z258_9SPHN|nr:HAMP domain-containing sensor histidine kinase [Sphingomicrobium lutaoense]MBB3763833.1 two-component system sensor histidine kinase ChvG [Sphingomicrobium lutaoense]